MIHIDNEKCTGCGACAAVCPALVIEKLTDNKASFAHPASCISCFHCVGICPVEAVTCDEFALDEFRKISKAATVTPAAMSALLAQRRSVREFSKKEIPRKLLEEIITDASHAPTGHNDRGVRLSVITNKKLIDKIDRRIFKTFDAIGSVVDNQFTRRLVKTIGGRKAADSFGTLMEDMDRFRNADEERKLMVFRNAPVLVVAHTSPAATTGKDDCIIFLDQLNLAANTRGLGATWIGFLVGAAKLDPTLGRPLGVPSKNTIHAAMVLGYPKYKYKRTIPHNPPPVKWME